MLEFIYLRKYTEHDSLIIILRTYNITLDNDNAIKISLIRCEKKLKTTNFSN